MYRHIDDTNAVENSSALIAKGKEKEVAIG